MVYSFETCAEVAAKLCCVFRLWRN